MPDAVVIGPGLVRVGVDPAVVGQPLGQGESPDGREVDPSGAQQIEPVRLRLGRRELVGKDVALVGATQLERAQHAERMGLSTEVVEVIHAVHVEARLLVAPQHALGKPGVEGAGRSLVTARAIGFIG